MKKLNEYNFNEGLDGVIIAKSLKQAVKKLLEVCDGYTIEEVIKDCADYDKNSIDSKGDWSVSIWPVPKKGKNRKSKFWGWR